MTSLETPPTPSTSALKRPPSASPARPAHPYKQARSKHSQSRHRKAKASAPKPRSEGTHDEILAHELRELHLSTPAPSSSADHPLPEPLKSTIPLTIHTLSSTGDGLAVHTNHPGHTFIVPFSLPGDVVLAKPVRHVHPLADHEPPSHTVCDLLSIESPSADRDDARIGCRYFASCSGCQFQMADYDYQLAHKRRIVEKAYRFFSGLPADLVPEVAPTVGSPLQYGYRTKLTPHFDGPPGGRRAGRKGETARFESVPEIGFMKKGTRRTLDIEECPIGTPSVQKGLIRERQRVAEQLDKYRRGATILLRETTARFPTSPSEETPTPDMLPLHSAESPATATYSALAADPTATFDHHPTHTDIHTCTSANNSTTTEYVDAHVFQNPANAFFQNNNSILPTFTAYIRDQLRPHCPPLRNLIDAYSGSGLFTIALAPLFHHTIGIDISAESIASARTNAALNRVAAEAAAEATSPPRDRRNSSSPPPDSSPSVAFSAGTAANIFAAIPPHFRPADTALVIDPPRKGCDTDFLRQLLRFGPRVVVYVSCNVHTQARDVGWLLRETTSGEEGSEGKGGYAIASLRGFDFFPQTGHVEGVAVLRRRDVA